MKPEIISSKQWWGHSSPPPNLKNEEGALKTRGGAFSPLPRNEAVLYHGAGEGAKSRAEAEKGRKVSKES